MYFYVNQTDYPHIIYPTMVGCDVDDGAVDAEGNALPPLTERLDTTIRSAGCGVSCASMLVTNLTGEEFSLAQSLELSMSVGANHSPGTDMGLFAPYLAERFDLDLVVSDDVNEVRAYLANGYMAIANVGGDRPEDGYVGLFSHGGHFVTVVDIDPEADTVTVLDPSQLPDKFLEEGRRGKVTVNGHILHCKLATLMEDCKSRATSCYAPGSEFRRWLEYAGHADAGNHIYLFGVR